MDEKKINCLKSNIYDHTNTSEDAWNSNTGRFEQGVIIQSFVSKLPTITCCPYWYLHESS